MRGKDARKTAKAPTWMNREGRKAAKKTDADEPPKRQVSM